LTNVQLSDQGRYICEARSDAGRASDYINLRVDRKCPNDHELTDHKYLHCVEPYNISEQRNLLKICKV
jgi:hypothetical protein